MAIQLLVASLTLVAYSFFGTPVLNTENYIVILMESEYRHVLDKLLINGQLQIFSLRFTRVYSWHGYSLYGKMYVATWIIIREIYITKSIYSEILMFRK